MVHSTRLVPLGFLALVGAVACSSEADVGKDPGSGASGSEVTDQSEQSEAGNSDGNDESSDEDGGSVDFDLGNGGDSEEPAEQEVVTDEPEVCDGIDNDGDGQIDNVDEGGDGICDCLNIGTIGRIGPWSSGGDIFKDWLDARSPLPAVELGDAELTDDLLGGLNVVVVLRSDTAPLDRDDSPAHHEFSEAEVEAMRAWVESGGGLMTTIGYQGNEVSEVQNVNRLLAPFQLGYDEEKTNLDNGFLQDWNQSHPISNGVSRINIANGVQPMIDVGTIVARGDDERVGVVAHEPGNGRVIVFGDEWVTYDSEWEDVEEQQVELLWLNMIKWMSPPKSCQVDIPPELIVR